MPKRENRMCKNITEHNSKTEEQHWRTDCEAKIGTKMIS